MTEGVLKVRALEQAVRSAEQVVISNRRSFEAGSRTLMDTLNAEQQRVAALRDLAQARYMYLISRVRLQALAGGAASVVSIDSSGPALAGARANLALNPQLDASRARLMQQVVGAITLASVLAIRAALRVDPADAIGG